MADRISASGERSRGQNPVTLLSLMILIGVEVFAVAVAGGWAVGGLFELGETVSYGLMAAFSLGAAWLMLQLWRRATTVDQAR